MYYTTDKALVEVFDLDVDFIMKNGETFNEKYRANDIFSVDRKSDSKDREWYLYPIGGVNRFYQIIGDVHGFIIFGGQMRRVDQIQSAEIKKTPRIISVDSPYITWSHLKK